MKLIDTAGRVDKFRTRYKKRAEEADERALKKERAAENKEEKK
jgi:hypothetical protein